MEGDRLIIQVMRERGYPVDDFDRRAADISVDHPEVVDHYRSAHSVADRAGTGGADTEELREAFVHYRALFEVLLDARDVEDEGVVDVRDHVQQGSDDPVVYRR
jgi:hypothetical protein